MSKVLSIMKRMQQNELTESVIYEKIARFAKGEENRKTLLRLSQEEKLDPYCGVQPVTRVLHGIALSFPYKAIHHSQQLIMIHRFLHKLVVSAANIAAVCLGNNAMQYVFPGFSAVQDQISRFLFLGYGDQFYHIPVVDKHRLHAAAGNGEPGAASVFQLEHEQLR